MAAAAKSPQRLIKNLLEKLLGSTRSTKTRRNHCASCAVWWWISGLLGPTCSQESQSARPPCDPHSTDHSGRRLSASPRLQVLLDERNSRVCPLRRAARRISSRARHPADR